jgi:RNA polymerase sigma-B factor
VPTKSGQRQSRAREREESFAIFLTDSSRTASRDEARDALIASHLPLVEHVAKTFIDLRVDRADLVQVGTIGLIRALDRFDPARGVQFSTYAVHLISGEIRHYLRDEASCVHVPRELCDRRTAVARAAVELRNCLGREPQLGELARATDFTKVQVAEAIGSAAAAHPASLDEEGAVSRIECAREGSVTITDPGLLTVEIEQTARALLNVLTPGAREVVDLYFFAGLSQVQIADQLGIAQVTVSRTMQASLRRMRAAAARDWQT